MKIYYSPDSPFVRKCMLTAQDLGLPAIGRLPSQVGPVERDPTVIQSNPLGKVPTLFTGEGKVLYDSRVICEYLDSLGGGKLFPSGAQRWELLADQVLADGIRRRGARQAGERGKLAAGAELSCRAASAEDATPPHLLCAAARP